jgi:hypothetical protein
MVNFLNFNLSFLHLYQSADSLNNLIIKNDLINKINYLNFHLFRHLKFL